MEMDVQTQAEYNRIKNGPHKGWFTLLHHEGPLIEQAENVMERIDYIVREKPQKELYLRLRHIRPISAPAQKGYDETMASAQKGYDETIASAQKGYDEAMAPAQKAICADIPDCAWNGKTIFSNR